MFGYIRPQMSELKMREFEQFRACYCGLCRTLGKKYGLGARFTLNYDFVFLSMLLWPRDEDAGYCMKRCPVSLLRKKCMCAVNKSGSKCASYGIILAYWKIKDSVSDGNIGDKVKYTALRLGLRHAYKKAAAEHPDFDRFTADQLSALGIIERTGEGTLDSAADKFASIISSIAEGEEDEVRKRTLSQLLYHVGRFIYIADAVDDLADDTKSGQFNPLNLRFDIENGVLSDENKETLRRTMCASENLAASAYEILGDNCWAGVIRNILYLGMPGIREQVLCGTFNNTKVAYPSVTGFTPDMKWRDK